MKAWPFPALAGALLMSLAWGASEHATAGALHSELTAEDRRARDLEREVQRLTESLDALQDEWHTLNVVRTAIDLSPPPNEPPILVRPERPIVVRPAAAPAFLNINSMPPSTCVLDGRTIGDTPLQHVEVSPGRHVVQFVGKNSADMRVVYPSAGETKLVTTKLESEGDGF